MKPPPTEVDVAHGKTRAAKTARRPGKARGLRALLPASPRAKKPLTPLPALESLQAHLRLTPLQARRWIATASDARR